ncbi:hypothetical protein E2542_SST21583 [Spatholobus suberectus]|nr:hypothetical protein E2542_SST21583 [Spatholobus suberectus]
MRSFLRPLPRASATVRVRRRPCTRSLLRTTVRLSRNYNHAAYTVFLAAMTARAASAVHRASTRLRRRPLVTLQICLQTTTASLPVSLFKAPPSPPRLQRVHNPTASAVPTLRTAHHHESYTRTASVIVALPRLPPCREPPSLQSAKPRSHPRATSVRCRPPSLALSAPISPLFPPQRCYLVTPLGFETLSIGEGLMPTTLPRPCNKPNGLRPNVIWRTSLL